MNSNIFLLLLIIKFSLQINQQQQGIQQNKFIINKEELKKMNIECYDIEPCKKCNFEQLKEMVECSATGLLKTKKCMYYNYENELQHEQVITDSCEESKFKVENIYKIMIVFIVLLSIALIVRKKEKKRILGLKNNPYKYIKST